MRWARLVLMVATVLLVFAAVMLLVAVEARSEPPSGVDVPREAVNYAGYHTTLWGKIAALSHYDVLKTTEPLTCSDGAANFTCLLSKTDIKPIINALRRIGAEPEVKTLNATWVLILYYNYTAGSWQWRNYTATGAWELKWNNQTARIYQAKIKKSLGEMLKIKEAADRRLLLNKDLKGITMIAVIADRIVVGTTNGTNGVVDENTKRRIIKKVAEIDPEVDIDVVYYVTTTAISRDSQFRPIVSGIHIETKFTTDLGESRGRCTLGFNGKAGGSDVFMTAWHCINWTHTTLTSGNSKVYQPFSYLDSYLISSNFYKTCTFSWYTSTDLVVTCDIITYYSQTTREPKVLRYIINDTPQYAQVVKKLCRYDVTSNTPLYKSGVASDETTGYIKSYSVSVTYLNQP